MILLGFNRHVVSTTDEEGNPLGRRMQECDVTHIATARQNGTGYIVEVNESARNGGNGLGNVHADHNDVASIRTALLTLEPCLPDGVVVQLMLE